MRIVEGADEAVGLFVLRHIPDIAALPGGYAAVGIARGEALVGGGICTNYVPCKGGGEIQIWAAGRDWLSRRTIGVLLGYPFGQLGCHRITAIVAKRNRPSRRLVEGLGFKLEGVARDGLRPGADACIYGLLKRECRWV